MAAVPSTATISCFSAIALVWWTASWRKDEEMVFPLLGVVFVLYMSFFGVLFFST